MTLRARCLRLLAAGCMSMVASLMAAAPAGAAESSILLGMSSPLTGPTGAYGQQMKQGIEAVFARVNAAGGVGGRQLKLTVLDDGYEVDRAVANTRRLIGTDHVFALLGFYGTASSVGVMPVLDETGVPLVGTVSGAEALRAPSNKLMFHMRASYGDETAAIVRNLDTVGIDRIAVLYQDDGFGQAGLNGVQKALAALGKKTVAAAPVPRNSLDVSKAVAAISAAQPQAVVLVALYRPAAAFIKQMNAAGVHPFYAALSPIGTDALVNELGTQLSRGVQVAQVIPNPVSNRVKIVREYQRDLAAYAKDAKPSYYGLEGYINARLMVAALERVGSNLTRERLVNALRAGPFDLGGFTVNFDRPGNAGSTYVEISVIDQDGHVLN